MCLMAIADYQRRWEAALMANYGTPSMALVRGAGAEVWDVDGRRYLDLIGGVAVNALGHAHPAVTRAVTEQISTLGQVSNFFITEPAITLAETLLDLLGAGRRLSPLRAPSTAAPWGRLRSPASPPNGIRFSRCHRA
jgi:acetylornithine aminotransferase